MLFAIVAFANTDLTDFVPLKWIADGTKLSSIASVVKNKSLVNFYWPPAKNPLHVSKAQLRCSDPEADWPTHLGRILGTAGKEFNELLNS